ncbi:MAG: molybdenum cofactor guanylyltransferase [Acidobacteriota bacterium]|nr:molybdenum cofactor guanylyltransferase [Acidobacteriota bacterium]
MNNIEGFILAGGASRRMGRDKAKLRLEDKTFIDLAANALHKITGGKISVVGNLPFENLRVKLPSNKTYELLVIADVQDKNSPAALVGLHAALIRAERNWAAVVACDLPFVTADLFERLAAFVAEEDFDAVVPVQPDGTAQPLCAFYKCAACLLLIEEMLRGDDWSLRNFLKRINTRFIEFERLRDLPDSDFFFLNVNTPEDYLAAQKFTAVKRSNRRKSEKG